MRQPGFMPHQYPNQAQPFMANAHPVQPYGMPMGAPPNMPQQNNLNMDLGTDYMPSEIAMYEVDIKQTGQYGAKQK